MNRRNLLILCVISTAFVGLLVIGRTVLHYLWPTWASPVAFFVMAFGSFLCGELFVIDGPKASLYRLASITQATTLIILGIIYGISVPNVFGESDNMVVFAGAGALFFFGGVLSARSATR